MCPQPNIAATAFLISDPARATMLMTLVDGHALPAGELAYAAGVTAQTASTHLATLLAGGLVEVEVQGRHRYYRLGGPHVALLLENLASVAPSSRPRTRPLSRDAQKLRFARCCYDHLAGQLGVAMTQALEQRGMIVAAEERQFEVTPDGVEWFGRMGLDVQEVRPNRRGLARQCLDWSERQHHLAGPLGVHWMKLLCANGALRRVKATRAVQVTPQGWVWLKEHLGIEDRFGELMQRT
jgi:DNA-binding transcriptional ArsR family regulator